MPQDGGVAETASDPSRARPSGRAVGVR